MPCRRRKKRRGCLTLTEKHEIVHKVESQLLHHRDMAKQYGTLVATVSLLIAKVRKKPGLLQELDATQASLQQEDQVIQHLIKRLNSSEAIIDSRASLT